MGKKETKLWLLIICNNIINIFNNNSNIETKNTHSELN